MIRTFADSKDELFNHIRDQGPTSGPIELTVHVLGQRATIVFDDVRVRDPDSFNSSAEFHWGEPSDEPASSISSSWTWCRTADSNSGDTIQHTISKLLKSAFTSMRANHQHSSIDQHPVGRFSYGASFEE